MQIHSIAYGIKIFEIQKLTILPVDNERLDHFYSNLLLSAKNYFINLCLDKIYFIQGKLQFLIQLPIIMHSRNYDTSINQSTVSSARSRSNIKERQFFLSKVFLTH